MTISSTTREVGPFTGNGVQTVFPFSFVVPDPADAWVAIVPAGSSPVLARYGIDYTVTLNSDQSANPGGSVRMASALSTGTKMFITSGVQPLQGSALINAGGFFPEVIERALDRLTILIQQINGILRRAILLPFGTPSNVSSTLPLPASNNLIGWNASADALQNVDPGMLAATIAGQQLYGATQAKTFSGNSSTLGFVLPSTAGTVNNLQVYIAGVRKNPGTDYTLSADGVTLVFSAAPATGTDNILCVWQSVLPASSMTFSSETATAFFTGQTAVSLPTLHYSAGLDGALTVYLNGLKVRKTADYLETSSTSVTFNTPLYAGDEIEFIVGSAVGTRGADGVSAFTTVSTTFSQPAVAAPVVAVLANNAWLTPGSVVYIVGGGTYSVSVVGSGGSTTLVNLGYPGNAAPGATVTSTSAVVPAGLKGIDGSGTGTVTSTSVVTANGFQGSVATSTVTPAITLQTSIAGMLKGVANALVAAVAGTDYVAPGGALGTPSSGTLTNATGLPISTGVAGLGTGVATFLATPSSANLATALTDETGTGSAVFATNPALTTPAITGTREVRVAMGANDINCASGNVFTKTISGAATLTVSNVPASGNSYSFVLVLTNGGSAVVTWFSGVKWAGGAAPTLTTTGRDRVFFMTEDGGTTWDATVAKAFA